MASINADVYSVRDAATPERSPSSYRAAARPDQLCSGLWLSNKYFPWPAGNRCWGFCKNQLFCHPLNKHVSEHSCCVRPRPTKVGKNAAWVVLKPGTNIDSISAESHNRCSRAVLSFSCFCIIINLFSRPDPYEALWSPTCGLLERMLGGGSEDTGQNPASITY